MRADVTPKTTQTLRQLSEYNYFESTRCHINKNNNLKKKIIFDCRPPPLRYSECRCGGFVGNSKKMYKTATAGVAVALKQFTLNLIIGLSVKTIRCPHINFTNVFY